MTKTKPASGGVRLFGAGTPDAQRPTVQTDCGLIYADTPEAKAYFEMKVWVDELSALSKNLDGMLTEKAQTVADIAALLPKLPEGSSRCIATLRDLSGVLQGRMSSHSGANFRDAGQAYAVYVVELRNHAERARFGLGMAGNTATRPPHPSQGPAPKRGPAVRGNFYEDH